MTAPSYRRDLAVGDRALRFLTLLWALTNREWRSRYRRSLLGPLWVLIKPIAYMVVFVLLKDVLGLSSEGLPYAVFSFSALVPWTLFSNALGSAGASIFGNAALLKKVDAPREVYPLAAVLVSLLDFLIALAVLFVLLLVYEMPLGVPVLLVPLLALGVALTALGLGLGIAALGTYKRDFVHALPFGLQLLILMTPVFYPLSQVPEGWRTLYALNPMVGLTEAFRAVLTKGVWPDFQLLGISALVIVLIWIVSWPLFRLTGRYFADVL